MIRIVCTKCKNAYLQNKGDELICPSCEATFSADKENLLLGVQYYNEGNFTEADNNLMKYIVKNGAEPEAIIYKAFCDAYSFDEDTTSLKDIYAKIIEALGDISDDTLPEFIALANDEAKKFEVALTDFHIRLFADADAEKIKKQVATVLDIQKEARAFRSALTDIVNAFNERNAIQLSVKFSDCFFVSSEIAAEVGETKYKKICDNIAAHTVFTGILSNDIKNLEIYYRCIVMFFEKSHDKYEFLLRESAKFTELAEILEQGQYNTIKGTAAIGTKLKGISYEFLEESYKEHFDEDINMQTQTVVIIEPEIPEEAEAIIEAFTEDITSNEAITDEAVSIPSEEAIETDETDADIEASDDTLESEDNVIEIETQDTEETELVEATVDTVSEADVIEINEDPEASDIDDANEAIEAAEASDENESISENIETTDAVVEITATDEIEEDSVIDVEDTSEENDNDEAVVEVIAESNEVAEEIIEDVATEVVADTTVEISDNDTEEVTESEKANESSDIIEAALEEVDNEKPKKKKKSHKGILIFVLILIVAGAAVGFKYIPGFIDNYKYNNAIALYESGSFDEAAVAFDALNGYKDSNDKRNESIYSKASKLEEEKKYAEAIAEYKSLGVYKDCGIRIQSCTYSQAKVEMDNGNFDKATELFKTIIDYGDSNTMITECTYRSALKHIENKEVAQAIELLSTIPDYSDVAEKINEAKYIFVTENFDAENETTVAYLDELTIAKYRNAEELRTQLLGSANVMSGKIKAFVNYSATDMETALTELDNAKTSYFHVVVEDESLYGQRLSIKYRTAFGYTQSKSVYFSAEENSSYVSYPPTKFKNYEVTFQLVDANGNVLAEQVITF